MRQTQWRRLLFSALAATAISMLSACEKSTAPIPPAQNITGDEIGYFCRMLLVNHTGPKGQIHLLNQEDPLWFTSVRDTLAFTQLPGESKAIAAIYVNDLAHTPLDSNEPSPYWLDAKAAWFVMGSDAVGGMGMPELVPFESRQLAAGFVEKHGGQLVQFGDIQLQDVQ